MARRQRRFVTRSSPLVSCLAASSQASTSGRDLSVLSFGVPGRGALDRQGRALPFASTVIKAQAKSETVAPKAAPSGGDKPIHDVLAGAFARAISQATIHPIDTLKVRMQAGIKMPASAGAAAAALPHHLPTGHRLAPIDRLAGAVRGAMGEAKSLYRGVLGAASGAGVIIGAFFAFYSTTKLLLRERTDLSEGTVAFIAGAVAAVGSSVIKVPIAVCIRSVQAGVYPNFLAAATSVVRKAGPRGLFTGFLPTLLEDVPDMAVKFAVYETLRTVHMQLHPHERPSTVEDLLMGGVAGSAAAAATTPLDVVKTRMMCSASERPTVMQAARGILAERPGMGSFFRGVGPRTLSNGLNSAIFYMWFELLRSKLRQLLAERHRQLLAGQAIPALLVGGRGALQQHQQALAASGSGSGSGHQAVASCSHSWLAGTEMRQTTCAEPLETSVSGRSQVASGSTATASQNSEATPQAGRFSGHASGSDAPGVHAGASCATPGVAAVRRNTVGHSGHISAGRIACLSLALPLLNAGVARPFRGSG